MSQAASTSERATGFATLAEVHRMLRELPDSGAVCTGPWTLPQVLVHVAQSVEYSLRGFPQLRSAAFRHTVGRLAFAVFSARGAMRHPLDAPIPGAPPWDDALDLTSATRRLAQALSAFEQHEGPFAPHFAYGQLDKSAYTRAHLMHLSEHWTQVQGAASLGAST